MTSGSAPGVDGGSFLTTWVNALTKPREETYAALASSPKAKATTAYLWIFLCSFAPALVTVLVSGGRLAQRLADAGVDTGQFGGGLGSALVNILCVTPFAAVLGIVGFIISVGLMQWIARMFGGQGTFAQMAYTIGAIAAPSLLITAVLTLPAGVPFLGLCVGGLSALFSIYITVLDVMAIKAVQRFGWGAAIGTLIIPGLAIGLVVCCVVAVILSVTGVALGSVMSGINQGAGF